MKESSASEFFLSERKGKVIIFHVEGPKTEKAREPTVSESPVRGIWRLRALQAELKLPKLPTTYTQHYKQSSLETTQTNYHLCRVLEAELKLSKLPTTYTQRVPR